MANGNSTDTRRLLPLFAGVAVVATCALLCLTIGGAVPMYHDEFSYMLAGETFASGRLTNPPLGLGGSFETFHVLQSPTYMSKYPPGQAVFLALGILLGDAQIGVWLSCGLAAAACVWSVAAAQDMLVTVLVAILAPLILGFSYWSHSFYGGAVATLGGALLWGALLRSRRSPTWLQAAIAGSGIGLLLSSRPFEGLIFCAVVVLVHIRESLGSFAGGCKAWSAWWLRVLACVLPFLAAFASYNHAVTGEWGTLPYSIYENQHTSVPMFAWQSLREPIDLPVPAVRLLDQEMREGFAAGAALGWRAPLARWQREMDFFFEPALLLGLPCLWVSNRRRFILWNSILPVLVGTALIVTVAVVIYPAPHYLAPFTAPIIAAFACGLASAARLLTRRWPRSLWVVIAAMAAVVGVPRAVSDVRLRSKFHATWAAGRAALEESLSADGGKHLVFVRYDESHHPWIEWVYNHANLEAAAVVWARTLSPAQDAAVVAHFRGRKSWLLDVWDDHWRLSPLDPTSP